MAVNAEHIRWAATRRLEFLEQRLFWDGRVNRSDLTQKFNISVPQASVDLHKYQQIAPANIEYDKKAKAYLSTASFQPIFGVPSADTFLTALYNVPAPSRGGDFSIAAVPEIKRRIEPEILRLILRAIRDRTGVWVKYQSMSSEDSSWRMLEPHGLGFDGARWHARAFCERHRDFRDFVLSRVFEIRDGEPSMVPLSLDIAWSTVVTVRLKANPNLSRSIRQAVEREHAMIDGLLEVCVPVCLSFYLQNLYGATNAQAKTEPARHQVVIANARELRASASRAQRETLHGLNAFWLEHKTAID